MHSVRTAFYFHLLNEFEFYCEDFRVMCFILQKINLVFCIFRNNVLSFVWTKTVVKIFICGEFGIITYYQLLDFSYVWMPW